MEAQRNRWVGVITPHARQRYVERVDQPLKFSHLRNCRTPNCSTCVSQCYDIRRIVKDCQKYIDWAIREKIALSQAGDGEVKNVNFLEVIRKTYPADRAFKFWQHKYGIYVTISPPDEPSPVLLTVMSEDMVDGTVIQNATSMELTEYFDRWKRDSRTLTYQREIKNL